MIETDETLLQRVQRLDAHDAWKEFYDNYWAAIIRYGRKLGLSQTQAEDVLQETMVDLMRILPKFTYEPNRGKFRNFLFTIVHRKALRVFRRLTVESNVPWEFAEKSEKMANSNPNAADMIEAQRRWKESIYETALSRLRNDRSVEPSTWEIFEAYVVKKRPCSEVAKSFGVKPNAVYQIKNRLLRRIRADVTRQLRNSGTDSEDPISFEVLLQ